MEFKNTQLAISVLHAIDSLAIS